MISAKNIGERGHSCLVLLVSVKGLRRTPEVRTLANGFEYSALMAPFMYPVRSKVFNTTYK